MSSSSPLHVVCGLLLSPGVTECQDEAFLGPSLSPHKDAVLLAKLAPHRRHAGFWEFPGGKVEAHESPEEALQREWREELALEIKVKQRLGAVLLKENILLDAYLIALQKGKIGAFHKDHCLFTWLRPKDAGPVSIPLMEGDLRLLKMLLEMQNSFGKP